MITDPSIVAPMSDLVKVALIGAVSGVIAAGVTLLNTWLTLRMRSTVRLLEKNTNSIKDALIQSVGEAEFAKGVISGKAEEKKGGG